MKQYEITVDAYGTRKSKCFHKLVEAGSFKDAEIQADKWSLELMDRPENDDLGEFEVSSISIYGENIIAGTNPIVIPRKINDEWYDTIDETEC